jgi:hypothetical protein
VNAAIQETQRLGSGVAADEVIEKLKSKRIATSKVFFEFGRK